MLTMQTTGATQMLAGLDLGAQRLGSLRDALEAAGDEIYLETQHRFDTESDGDWPQLAESTVAKKASQGYAEPERILYAEGNLYESATSPNGPYSQRIYDDSGFHQRLVLLVDWENDGWQIPTVLSEGSDRGLPSRPIWPPAEQMVHRVREILLRAAL